ncbi:MAG: hypothetical protein PF638_04285 [Candidatus Delongbacteria bacterium]|jgi:hypothetical protein|nr:hypothetical protein [Candidatus Delongbacteria bacterium]
MLQIIENNEDWFDISETVIELKWRFISTENFNDVKLEFRTCCDTFILGYWFDFEDRKRFKIVCRLENKQGMGSPFQGILREFKDVGLEEFILEYVDEIEIKK